MNKERKAILGQWHNNRLYFSDDEKRRIIEDYLSGNEVKRVVYNRYTGYSTENGKITKWMRGFGIVDKYVKITNFENMPMKKKDIELGSEDFETLKLKKRIAELEKQLQTSEMKAIAFSTMVDIAEKEFNIPIRKKYNTKP
jgi:DNA primase catalytic subunit